MRVIPSIQDEMNGTVTFDCGNGQYLTVDARELKEYGVKEIAKAYGIKMTDERVPVFQRDRKIGTLPAAWHPSQIKSTSFFYEPRGGDFVRTDRGWEAARNLGPGDFEAVPDFIWERGA